MKIEEFDPKQADADRWQMYHRFRQIRHQESRPDDPLTPSEVVEKMMKQDHPHNHSRYFAVVDGGEVLASLGAGTAKPAAPDYEENKHLLWADLVVHPDHRRKGIARSLLPTIKALMDEYGNTVFTTGTEQESGRAFLNWLRAEEKMQAAENRLDFTEIDWDMISNWIAEGAERSPHSEMKLFEDRLPDELLQAYCPVYSEVMNQQPFDDLNIGKIEFTPEVFKEQYKRFDQLGAAHHTMITFEPDGAISGLTEVMHFPHRPTYLTQNLTGVVDTYRGRGLGKLLKAAMLDYAHGKYPDLKWVVTGNAHSNDPMLSINKRLGFREFKGNSLYQISKEGLEAAIARG